MFRIMLAIITLAFSTTASTQDKPAAAPAEKPPCLLADSGRRKALGPEPRDEQSSHQRSREDSNVNELRFSGCNQASGSATRQSSNAADPSSRPCRRAMFRPGPTYSGRLCVSKTFNPSGRGRGRGAPWASTGPQIAKFCHLASPCAFLPRGSQQATRQQKSPWL